MDNLKTETKSQTTTSENFAIGITLIIATLTFLAFIVAVVGQKDVKVTIEGGGLSNQDLRLATMRCTPGSATFEQELACFQAVYGSLRK